MLQDHVVSTEMRLSMLKSLVMGTGLGARVARSAGWTIFGYGTSQVLRLISNLVLTRLLYPEAFGLMALITVFLVAMTMISDVGIGPSIQQSSRGEDQDFLDTAWTLQVLRGGILWALCCAASPLIAIYYSDERLASMLPVAGATLLISGFNPTSIEVANRKLMVGLVTTLDVVIQLLGLLVTVWLSWQFRSVWALVIGGVVSSVLRLAIMHVALPGKRNSFKIDWPAATELVHFGKWIFLSTLCGFLLSQGDKAILGRYLNLEMLGVYSIGYFLATSPQFMASALMQRIMIPLHRECPPGESPENFGKIRRTRFLLTGLVLTLQFILAFSGVALVGLLYDNRFAAAGAVVVAVTCMNVPYLIGMTYDQAALAASDSRGVFILVLAKAIAQTALFIVGAEFAGLPGAMIGLWASQMLVHPLVIRIARKHGAWDVWHDVAYGGAGLLLTALALWAQKAPLAMLWDFAIQ